MRRLTISLDIAFGKDAEEEVAETGQMGSADTVTERRASDEAMETRTVGFGRGPWIDE